MFPLHFDTGNLGCDATSGRILCKMDQALKAAAKVITVLFAIGVVGCVFVIPITAVQWVAALFEPDTEEEMARSLSRPMRSSDAG
jgi:hypothetical protein